MGCVLKANLIGRFRLEALDGRDLTPKNSAKAQGLLAILLLSKDMERPREYLIDKLWSDRQQGQGAGSLKTELYTIRKALGDLKDLVQTEHGVVRLCQAKIERDIDTNGLALNPSTELFEGLAVRDPEFVSWLEEQRRHFAARATTQAKPKIYLAKNGSDAPLQRSVLLGGFQHTLADWCAEQLVVTNGEAPDFAACEADTRAFVMEHILATGRSNVTSSLTLTRVHDSRMLFHRIDNLDVDPCNFIDEARTYRAINASVDQTLFEIAPPDCGSSEARYLQRGALGAIRLIFRNRANDLELARSQLAKNYDTTKCGLHLAWIAYTLTYFKGERAQSQEDLRDEAEELARRAIELAPHNSMALALLSYVYTYLLDAPQVGLGLAERSTDINRSNPLGWAFRGVALYTLGNYEAGYNLTRFARSIAGDGPYKYAVETYFCIASTLANKLDEAIHAGEIAYQLKPDFNASLRYLAVLYAHKGDRRRHNTVLSQLRRSDPEFSIQKMLEHSTYPSEVLRKAPILFLEG